MDMEHEIKPAEPRLVQDKIRSTDAAEFVAPSAQQAAGSIDTGELRRLAEAATPGYWTYWPTTEDRDAEIAAPCGVRVANLLQGDVTKDNSAFIAAANPSAILRLLDALAAATPAQPIAPQEPMTTDEAREFLIGFMNEHFTDRTFHRYIRADQVDKSRLAGDFAWQMATALRKIGASPCAMCNGAGSVGHAPDGYSDCPECTAPVAQPIADMSAPTDERAAFEMWARRTHTRPGTHFDRSHNGVYKDNRIAAKWAAWQAARAAAPVSGQGASESIRFDHKFQKLMNAYLAAIERNGDAFMEGDALCAYIDSRTSSGQERPTAEAWRMCVSLEGEPCRNDLLDAEPAAEHLAQLGRAGYQYEITPLAASGAAMAGSRGAVLEEAAMAMAHRGWTDSAAAIRAMKSERELHPDDTAVDRFAIAMKVKMKASRAKGRGGWDDPAQCTVEKLAAMLCQHVEKGDPVDIANFAMMIHQRGGCAIDVYEALAVFLNSRSIDSRPRSEDSLADGAELVGSHSSAAWRSQAEALAATNQELRERLQLRHQHQAADVWYWQGDDGDNLQSMGNAMVVVIRADQLRALASTTPQKADNE